MPTSTRKDPAERRQKGTIGCLKRWPRLLPTKHQKLVPQSEQLDIIGELAAATTHEQPQQR
jgi:hypothetical protein